MIGTQTSKKHKLAVIGDSLAQGFKNGGIYRTDLSFPALLAEAMGADTDLQSPDFTAKGGIPINLEMLVRGLHEAYGDKIHLKNSVPAALYLYKTLYQMKRYWEGHIRPLRVERKLPYHNQAVWGFAISDALKMHEAYLTDYLKENRIRYSVFNILPDHAMYITARMVLNPGLTTPFRNYTMLDNIRYLQDHGGIENLIVCIGHNNVVGAVTKLNITYSEESDLNQYYASRNCTVFRPEHFASELETLYEKIRRLQVERVFVPTLPYITIPPAIRGVNEGGASKKGMYFDYYTRFWVWDEDFDPDFHPYLTKAEAIDLDQTVDEYNEIIREKAMEYDFHVVPVNRHVSAAARRRVGKFSVRPFPKKFIQALRESENTNYLVDEEGNPRVSTDYIRLDTETGKIAQGGIFSLDGLHPTTIGYGLIANIYKSVMENQGVQFEKDLNWKRIIDEETLVSDPPPLLYNLRLMLRWLAMGRREKFLFLGKSVLNQVLDGFTER